MGQTHPCCISEVATSGGEGGEREEGSGKVVEGIDDTIAAQQVVTLTITDPYPVGAECGERGEEEYMRGLPSVNSDVVQDLDSVSSLDQYYQITIMARMPALFQSHSGDNLVSAHVRITGPSCQVVGGTLHKYCT